MDVIEATSRTVKTMADGTLRLTVDISPIHAQDAFSLFGMPDVPLALARLTQEASQQSAQEQTIAKERVTGLALLAVEWSEDSNFWKWINHINGMVIAQSAIQAKDFICSVCGIESRKELNTNDQAAAQFQQEIRGPYMQWVKGKS